MATFFKSGKRSATQLEPIHTEVPEIRGAELNAVYYGQRVGGDFYDFLRVSAGRVLLGLLDVAGKHECARTVAVRAQDTFRCEAPRLFSGAELNEADAMIELCLLLNRSILGGEGGGVRPCPAFAACYNEEIGTVCYFNAGHTPALLRHNDGITELPATGLPLGLFSHVTCDAPTVALEPGGALVVVSRGMVEGTRKGEEYGLERAKALVQRDTAADARELCVALVDDVKKFMGTPPTHDDVTAVALVRDGRS
ncbi:MAG TPA: SpoIIE family protein phosphatase [Terriglobales bacterium]|nr:SpoIIE family protein phosphatase [Terriglobales bacterium]